MGKATACPPSREQYELVGTLALCPPIRSLRDRALRADLLAAQGQILGRVCDQSARRANHRNLSSPLRKNILLNLRGKSATLLRPSNPVRGRVEMVTNATRELRLTCVGGSNVRRSRVVLMSRCRQQARYPGSSRPPACRSAHARYDLSGLAQHRRPPERSDIAMPSSKMRIIGQQSDYFFVHTF